MPFIDVFPAPAHGNRGSKLGSTALIIHHEETREYAHSSLSTCSGTKFPQEFAWKHRANHDGLHPPFYTRARTAHHLLLKGSSMHSARHLLLQARHDLSSPKMVRGMNLLRPFSGTSSQGTSAGGHDGDGRCSADAAESR